MSRFSILIDEIVEKYKNYHYLIWSFENQISEGLFTDVSIIIDTINSKEKYLMLTSNDFLQLSSQLVEITDFCFSVASKNYEYRNEHDIKLYSEVFVDIDDSSIIEIYSKDKLFEKKLKLLFSKLPYWVNEDL